MKTYWQRIKTIVGPALRKDFNTIGQKQTRDSFEKFITSHSDKNSLLLDAGCNTGVEAVRLFEKGYKGKYLGVDSNDRAVKFARTNLKNESGAKFFSMDLEKLNFKDKDFDLVLVKDVIEHQQYYTKILTELARVTKKYLILSMFIKPSFFLGDKIKLHNDGYYLNRYNQRKLFGFLSKLHFKKPVKIYEDWEDVVYVFEKVI